MLAKSKDSMLDADIFSRSDLDADSATVALLTATD